jgi:chemotaxis response regulator CheB
MPGAVATAGLAEAVLPLSALAEAVVDRLDGPPRIARAAAEAGPR